MISHGYWLSLKGQRGGDVQGAARKGRGSNRAMRRFSNRAAIASARRPKPKLQWGWGSIVTAQRPFCGGVGVRIAPCAAIASARRPNIAAGLGFHCERPAPKLQWGRGSNRAMCGDCERPTPKAQVAVGLGFHRDRPAPILRWGRGSNRAMCGDCERPAPKYSLWILGDQNYRRGDNYKVCSPPTVRYCSEG